MRGQLTALALLFVVGCSSGSSNGTGTSQPKLVPCTSDAQCGNGQGCTSDSYCAPLCDSAATCPNKYDCKTKAMQTDSDCKDIGNHGTQGVCDLVDSFSSCQGSSSSACNVDSDCGAGMGCKLETGDNYCAPLCSSSAECPSQKPCTGGSANTSPNCKEIGQHGASGICDLYNGSYGPNTCK